jgi:hypothetical protein
MPQPPVILPQQSSPAPTLQCRGPTGEHMCNLQSSWQAWIFRTQSCRELRRACPLSPNENKLSDRCLERPWLRLKLFYSSENVNTRRAAVRSSAWLGPVVIT